MEKLIISKNNVSFKEICQIEKQCHNIISKSNAKKFRINLILEEVEEDKTIYTEQDEKIINPGFENEKPYMIEKVSKEIIMDSHDIILKIINDIFEESKKNFSIVKRKKGLLKRNDNMLIPVFCFRTGELKYEICKRLQDNNDAISLIDECFRECTLSTYYYIHISDLKTILLIHKEKGEWCVHLR